MIHQYKLNGYNSVLDTASGSVHVVDDVAYDIIGMYKDNSESEIIGSILEKYSFVDFVLSGEGEWTFPDREWMQV